MQRNRYQLSRAVLAVLVGASLAFTQEAPAPGEAKPAPAAIVVPADTTIPLALKNTLSSRTAYVGQAVYCETIYPITVGNRIVIPVGSYVKGAVTQVVRPGRIKGKAQLGIRFDSLTLPNGTTLALRATLSSYGGNDQQGFNREESKIEGESGRGKDAGTVATSAGQGAIIGAIAGRSVKGAGIGGAIGSAGGIAIILATRGKEVHLPAGSNLELLLSAPVTFEREELDPPSRYDDGPALPAREAGPSI